MTTTNDRLTEDTSIVIGLPELSKGERTTITYNGCLGKKGADKVYLHYGFDGWHNVSTIAMSETGEGHFSTKVKVEGNHELNFCFKDSANNWDNNNGTNWKTEIHPTATDSTFRSSLR